MLRRLPRSFSVVLLVVLALSSVLHASAAPAALQGDGPGAASPGGSIPIRLANFEFDPLAAGELDALLPHALAAAAGDGAGYYLVQFAGPIAEADRAGLEAAGADVFDYIPDFTFIVRMDGAARDAVEQQPAVRWVGPYLPAFRLSRDLLAAGVQADASAASAAGADGKVAMPVAGGTPEVVVDLFPGEPLDPVIAAVEAWGGQVTDTSSTEWRSKVQLTVASERLAELAALPGVRWIEAAPHWQLTNNKGTDAMGGRNVWNTYGLRGTGQVVAVADSGLDKGSATPANLHDDFENGSGATRVAAIFDRVGDGANDVNSGHGTHVAGSVLGNGKKSGSTPSTHTYPASSYAGLAPEATLVFQATERNSDGALAGIPLDLNELFAQAAGAGAKIHTNSWGSSVAGAYTGSSVDVDEYAWANKEFTILFAAGNDGIDSNADGVIDRYSMGSPATAKNAITVGASENNRPSGSTPTPGYNTPWGTGSWLYGFPVNPIRDDHVSNNIAGMAAFSSRGPTLDGRIKPDIVAPGTNIISTLSSAAPTDVGWGPVNADYVFHGGTSMATPLTAGAATLVRQFYTDKKGFSPSSALIKATLANGAANMAPGQYGTGATQEIANTRPTNAAGWGRVNLEYSLFPSSPRKLLYADERSGLSTGGSRTFNYNVTNSGQPLRVTLAWTDYPGSPAAGGGLVNDLDLQVVGPTGTVYYPSNANPRAATQHLTYDGGFPTGAFAWSAGKRVAVRFTPTSYPADLQLARFFVGAPYASNFPKTFKWYVYSGSASGPTTELANGTTTIRDLYWHTVDLAAKNIRINSGDFFIALELPDSNMLWAYDGSSPVDGRSWDFDGSSWGKWTESDYMINAVMTAVPPSTQQDRVNNLQGIDIASPPTGAYKVVVSGYNVARGPQPYALVVSGAASQVVPPLGKKLFLPVVQNKIPPVPPAPALNAIDNADGNGNYAVSWGAASGATAYVLVEDDNAGFSSPATVHEGAGLSWAATGKPLGTYYYRVQGKNKYGPGPWSGTQSALVAPVVLPGRFDSIADATVFDKAPTLNLGSTVDVAAGYDHCMSSPGIFRALVKFDLNAIPRNTPISKARLFVQLYDSCDLANRSMPLTAYRAGAGWSESGVNWNNQPSSQEQVGNVSMPSRELRWYSMDITGVVRDWINGARPNDGLVLRAIESSGNDSASLYFWAREAGAADTMYLQVTYPGAPPADASPQPAATHGCSGNSIRDLFAAGGGSTWARICAQ